MLDYGLQYLHKTIDEATLERYYQEFCHQMFNNKDSLPYKESGLSALVVNLINVRFLNNIEDEQQQDTNVSWFVGAIYEIDDANLSLCKKFYESFIDKIKRIK